MVLFSLLIFSIYAAYLRKHNDAVDKAHRLKINLCNRNHARTALPENQRKDNPHETRRLFTAPNPMNGKSSTCRKGTEYINKPKIHTTHKIVTHRVLRFVQTSINLKGNDR